MAPVTWKIGVYNRSGVPQNSTSYDGSVTDEFLKHFTNATLTIALNSIDTLEFTLYLDDPAALLIHKKQTVIRIWREIDDAEFSKSRTPPSGTPDFCGIVTGVNKSGEANTMSVVCQSPLWLVQAHFHLLNHRLVVDPSDVPSYREGGNMNDKDWDHSALMFHLIDLINGAFKLSGGDTGIRKPLTAPYAGTGYLAGDSLYWPQTIRMSPLYVQKGAYTWPILYDNLLSRAGSPDLVPEYIWDNGSIDMMYFKTAIVRGSDISGSMSLDYRTGNKNLLDVQEQSQVVPGSYANYIWVSGDGGPNGGVLKDASDPTDWDDNGIYMRHDNIPGVKAGDLDSLADSKLTESLLNDAEVYSVSVSPVSGIYYDIDYTLGDLVGLNADKGALQVTDAKQRIYQAALSYSDNNIESVDLLISADFKRRFPDA